MKMNKNIKFEYAQDLEQNERKWEERKEKLHAVIRFFTANTILQFTASEVSFRAYDFIQAIGENDRGRFLANEIDSFLIQFNKIKEDYETSGISNVMCDFARKITDNKL